MVTGIKVEKGKTQFSIGYYFKATFSRLRSLPSITAIKKTTKNFESFISGGKFQRDKGEKVQSLSNGIVI
jgi:hypothetical protein